MGRAIVREPKAFLMDEPLSNLDAKLRVQMRSEIERIQCELGVTTLYGARDQVEAIRHVRQSEWAIPSVRVRADWCGASAPGTGVSAVAVEPACPATAMMTTIAAAVGRYLLFASMVPPLWRTSDAWEGGRRRPPTCRHQGTSIERCALSRGHLLRSTEGPTPSGKR